MVRARRAAGMRLTVAVLLATTISGCVPSFGHRTQSSPTAEGPLHAVRGKLVDTSGREVRLTGVNWFGFETGTFAPHGLWARNWRDMLNQIAAAGFNTIRLPFSDELFDPGSRPSGIDYTRNPDLRGLQGLALMDRIVQGAGQRGLEVLLDRHQPTSATRTELWYTDQLPETRWISDWTTLAAHYRGNTAVVGADLDNEPHGSATWGDGNPRTDWRAAAERAGNAVLEVNPDWLIIVEGIERFAGDSYWYGGNLEGARQFPVRLSLPGHVVYSAHDYGPGVYDQTWFQSPQFPANLQTVWERHWAYLEDAGTAPVLIGEFGGRSMGQDTEGTWQRALLAFLKAHGTSYTYWSWNPDSGDTGGVLEDDWSTINPAKMDVLSAYEWPLLGHPRSGVLGAYDWPATPSPAESQTYTGDRRYSSR
jgi:endoglucanase